VAEPRMSCTSYCQPANQKQISRKQLRHDLLIDAPQPPEQFYYLTQAKALAAAEEHDQNHQRAIRIDTTSFLAAFQQHATITCIYAFSA